MGALVVVGVASLGWASASVAAPLTVTTRGDPAPNGCTQSACSLREAVLDANNAVGPDKIVLPAQSKPYKLKIEGNNEDAGATGDLDVLDTDGLTVKGRSPGKAVIDAKALDDRVFDAGGPLYLRRLTVANGSESNAGGGGIRASDILNIKSSVIRNNQASCCGGGGIKVIGGDANLSLTKSTVRRNKAAGSIGGGLSLSSTTITSTIERSTISNNVADTGGGVHDQGVAVIRNSTISGNRATGSGMFSGGGGYYYGSSATNARFRYATIANNRAKVGGANLGGGTSVLFATVLAQPRGDGNCGGDNQGSEGSNVASDGSCGGLTDATDLMNADAKLGRLAANGGPTQTHALLNGSDAIDAGPKETKPMCADPPDYPATDQRGVARAQGKRCDAGGYEKEKG